MKANEKPYDAGMVTRYILGAIDDDIQSAFCARCPELRFDLARDRDACPVSFKMTDPRCPRTAEYSQILEHADAIKDILSN